MRGRAQHHPGAVRRLQRAAVPGQARIRRRDHQHRHAQRGRRTPTPRRRTRSAPARPASSPRSTTSPVTATTSPMRPGAGRPAARTTSRTRPPRRPWPAATRSTASTWPRAPGTAMTSTSGIATGDNPEGEYAIFDGTHYNGGCCFDYGNAETSNNDTGNGHMEAIYFGNIKVWGYGTGNGPWIMADMENGLYSGVNAGYQRERPDHQRPVHHRHDRGRAEPVGHPGRQRAVRRPVHLLQRSAPQRVGLQPDAQGGRDHPRHRRRQQQGLRRHLLRRRDDLRLPVGRHRERGPGQHHLRRLRAIQRRRQRSDRAHRRRRQQRQVRGQQQRQRPPTATRCRCGTATATPPRRTGR